MDQSRPKKGRLHRRILASLSWVAGLLGVEVPCSEGHGVPTQEYSLLKLTCQVSSVNKVGMIGEMKAIKGKINQSVFFSSTSLNTFN